MKQTDKAAIVWGLLLVLFLVFTTPLAEELWGFYFFIYWGVALGGSIIFVVVVVRSFLGSRPPVLALVIVITGLALFFTVGFRLGRLAYFQIRKPHYERLLEETLRTGEPPEGQGYIDQGPPARYAFFWQRGVVDNWVGVVYDPTGSVMNVNGSEGWDDLGDPRWADVVGFFGGTLYKAERLQGHWYLCWFT